MLLEYNKAPAIFQVVATQIFFMFTPTYLGFHDPIWLPHIFSDGFRKNQQLDDLIKSAQNSWDNWFIIP